MTERNRTSEQAEGYRELLWQLEAHEIEKHGPVVRRFSVPAKHGHSGPIGMRKHRDGAVFMDESQHAVPTIDID